MVSNYGDCIEFEKCQCQTRTYTEEKKMESNAPKIRKIQNNLVLSLPGGDEGKRIKDALKDIATDNHRSLSNQVSLILIRFLKEEGKM